MHWLDNPVVRKNIHLSFKTSPNKKMTNKEDTDEGPTCDARFAAFLALHMVKQILDDAYFIANTAVESEQHKDPAWHCQLMTESVKDGDGENVSPNAESDVVNENKMEPVANIVATSTPQKVTDELLKSLVEPTFIGQGDEEQELQKELTKSTSTFINHLFDMSEIETVITSDDNETMQNNEKTQNNENKIDKSEPDELLVEAMTTFIQQKELTKSTSTFINHLFDMSEVETVISDDNEAMQNNETTQNNENTMDKSEPDKLLAEAMTTFIQQNELTKSTSTFINHLFDMSEVERVIISDDNETMQNNEKTQNNENTMDKSEPDELLAKAMTKIMESYIDKSLGTALEQSIDVVESSIPYDRTSSEGCSEYSFVSDAFVGDISKDIALYNNDTEDAVESEVPPIVPVPEVNGNENTEECTKNTDVARLENAYLSLNRDEHCSEDDMNIILADPKGMTFQEVELMTADTSSENLSSPKKVESEAKCEKTTKLTATSAVSAASKKSIVSRCRSKGAKLLACLRGWWRRKTPGVRKDHKHRISGTLGEMCPLSPNARRRAASLMDQRLLRSPILSHDKMWKFNTVNEALAQSSRWKDYTFEVNPEECGEY